MKILQFLSQNPDFQMEVTIKRLSDRLKTQLKEHAVSRTQALILIALYFENDRKASFDQLSQIFGISKGGLSQNLSFLESKNDISRLVRKGDRRANDISLNKNSESKCLSLIGIFDQHQREMEERVGMQELQQFFKTMQRL